MSPLADPSTNEILEKSKADVPQDASPSGGKGTERRQARRTQVADLSGFIGGELWMVGKYER